MSASTPQPENLSSPCPVYSELEGQPEHLEALEAHCTICASCAQAYQEQTTLEAAFQTLPTVPVPEGLTDRIMEAVHHQQSVPRRFPKKLSALAASFLILASTAALLFTPSPDPEKHSIARLKNGFPSRQTPKVLLANVEDAMSEDTLLNDSHEDDPLTAMTGF